MAARQGTPGVSAVAAVRRKQVQAGKKKAAKKKTAKKSAKKAAKKKVKGY